MGQPRSWNLIEGWLTEAEGNTLRAFAAGKTVLELGAFKGRSTVCMGEVAEQLVSIDHHKGDANVGWRSTLAEFLDNLNTFGLLTPRETGELAGLPRVEVMVTTIAEAELRGAEGQFDMAFVDCEHTVETTSAGLRLALAAVKPGGMIFWHDDDDPNVRAAVAACGLSPISVVDTLGWCTHD